MTEVWIKPPSGGRRKQRGRAGESLLEESFLPIRGIGSRQGGCHSHNTLGSGIQHPASGGCRLSKFHADVWQRKADREVGGHFWTRAGTCGCGTPGSALPPNGGASIHLVPRAFKLRQFWACYQPVMLMEHFTNKQTGSAARGDLPEVTPLEVGWQDPDPVPSAPPAQLPSSPGAIWACFSPSKPRTQAVPTACNTYPCDLSSLSHLLQASSQTSKRPLQ